MESSTESLGAATRIGGRAPDAVAGGAPLPVTAVFADPTRRPHRSLLLYYALCSVLFGPLFWAALLPYYFRYQTLRYRFDEEGVSMSWGLLFRREISLTYARIQDTHLVSNVVERWLSLARIQIQTASGSASAEMTIEGLQDFSAVRDFLYARMRGTRDRAQSRGSTRSSSEPAELALSAHELSEVIDALRSTAAEIRALRSLQEAPPEQPETRHG